MHHQLARTRELPTADAYADELRSWLLDDGPQIRGGEHDGGVLGWVATPDPFVYPEVIGYYLTALHFMASEDRAFAGECTARAGRALAWLDRRATWRTRDYLRADGGDDWRNQAAFTFDLGIILGGANHWMTNARTSEVASRVCRRCSTELQAVPLSGQGLLGSHRSAGTESRRMPERWSTLPGPHHVKVAALLEQTPAAVRPPAFHSITRRTLHHWRMTAESVGLIAEVHPLLYFLEGLVLDAVARNSAPPWEFIGRVLARVLSAQSAEGDLPERLVSSDGCRRSDVTAQALRLCVLTATGVRSRSSATELCMAAERLYDALTSRYLGPAGEVHSFPLHGAGAPVGPNPANVWAGIFTYQALRYYACLVDGEPVPTSLVCSLA